MDWCLAPKGISACLILPPTLRIPSLSRNGFKESILLHLGSGNFLNSASNSELNVILREILMRYSSDLFNSGTVK